MKIGKPFASFFVAGDTAEDAFRVAKELNKKGFVAIINFLGEEVKDEKQTRENAKFYINLIKEIRIRDILARISVKPTQMGIKISPDLYYSLMYDLAWNSFVYEVPLEIDIEGPETTKETIDKTILLSIYVPESRIRQAIAVNHKDSQSFIINLSNADIGIRLCKGAYASDLKGKKLREEYIKSAKFLIGYSRVKPELATHDLGALEDIEKYRREYDFPCGFQFLFGLRKRTWKKLKERGESVAIYVPFGKNWLPYAKRRWLYILKKIPSIILGN